MGGLASRSGTKRPNSKWKLLAKLADNIFHSTKPYRCPDAARLARQWCLLLTTIFPWSGRFLTKYPKAKARGSPITTSPHHTRPPKLSLSRVTVRPRTQWFRFSEVEKDKISAWQRWRAIKSAQLRERAHGAADTPPEGSA